MRDDKSCHSLIGGVKIKLSTQTKTIMRTYDHKAIKQTLWSREEEEIMRKNFTYLGIVNIMKLLPNRGFNSIRGKALLMGLHHEYQPRKLNLTETEKAYLAGIIDGEGYIGMIKGWRKSKGGIQYFTPNIIISNTDCRIIDWMSKRLVGLSIYNNIRPATVTQKATHHLRISGPPSVQAVLEAVLPYMVIKRERAELLLTYTRTRMGKRIGASYDIDPMPIAMKLNEMNKKGPLGVATRS